MFIVPLLSYVGNVAAGIAETIPEEWIGLCREATGRKWTGVMSEKPTYEELEKRVRELSRVKDEQNQALAVLRKSEEKYRLITEQTADFIYTVNIEREQFTYVTRSVERMFGFSSEECADLKVQDILTEASYTLQREEMLKAYQRRQRQPEVLELEAIHKDGHTMLIEVHARFLFDDEGNPVEILGVARDITERKLGEAERADLQLQLAQAQKMDSIGRLAGGVVHDFNNMLGVIIGRSEMALSNAGEDPSLKADLQAILKVARHSADLSRKLMAFARMQGGSEKMVDLNEILEDMLGMLRHLIGENIELDWRPGDGLWPVKMDSSQVNQILVNLCVNSRDAIGDVGRITIETENVSIDRAVCGAHSGQRPGDYVRISFSDSGCGIDPKILDCIFEPFFTTKKIGQGTGLGLSTVYGIVKQNNGLIDVSSEPGKGASFRICLPGYYGGADRIPAEARRLTALQGDEAILLVEDESTMLEMTAMLLKKMGHTVFTASDASEAIQLMEANPKGIQLLITDVVMPGMNGKDLADELLLREPDLKCLFMSGYAADKLPHHTKFDGAVSFLQKPFTLNDLMARVRAVLDGTSS